MVGKKEREKTEERKFPSCSSLAYLLEGSSMAGVARPAGRHGGGGFNPCYLWLIETLAVAQVQHGASVCARRVEFPCGSIRARGGGSGGQYAPRLYYIRSEGRGERRRVRYTWWPPFVSPIVSAAPLFDDASVTGFRGIRARARARAGKPRRGKVAEKSFRFLASREEQEPRFDSRGAIPPFGERGRSMALLSHLGMSLEHMNF